MGHRELLAALQREAEEQAAAIRRAAATEEEAMRVAAASRRDEFRAEQERHRKVACAVRQREILAETEHGAALVRLRAESGLAQRLRGRAGACLVRLRDSAYEALFQQLVSELPDVPWATIRVNPADTVLAAGCFPQAAVVADPAITGGLEAVTADGSLTVVNTLESRLERCWPDLVPHLIAELRGRPA